jgi:hypothetical protein
VTPFNPLGGSSAAKSSLIRKKCHVISSGRQPSTSLLTLEPEGLTKTAVRRRLRDKKKA